MFATALGSYFAETRLNRNQKLNNSTYHAGIWSTQYEESMTFTYILFLSININSIIPAASLRTIVPLWLKLNMSP